MLWMAALCGAVAGCAQTAPARPTPVVYKGPPAIDVPINVHWAVYGARPMVKVRVGNGPAVPVLLDTGSTGLHIYAPGVRLGSGSGVTLTNRPDSITYFDGMKQSGVVGKAKMTIGGVTTSRSVSFGYIDNVGCVDGSVDCPGAAGMGAQVSRGFYGILGVGLSHSPEKLGNPLLALPGRYGRQWSIDLSGSQHWLTLGSHIATGPLAQFTLAKDGTDPSGAKDWKDQETPVCWAAVGLHGAGCEPTVFDTGSTTMFWYGGLLSHATTYYGSILVSPGTYIAAWHRGDGHPFWTFTAGTNFSHDTVLAYEGGHPMVIAAVQAFLTFNIEYDDAHGAIRVYPPHAS
jgi:hypothetical protein